MLYDSDKVGNQPKTTLQLPLDNAFIIAITLISGLSEFICTVLFNGSSEIINQLRLNFRLGFSHNSQRDSSRSRCNNDVRSTSTIRLFSLYTHLLTTPFEYTGAFL